MYIKLHTVAGGLVYLELKGNIYIGTVLLKDESFTKVSIGETSYRVTETVEEVEKKIDACRVAGMRF